MRRPDATPREEMTSTREMAEQDDIHGKGSDDRTFGQDSAVTKLSYKKMLRRLK